MRRVLVLVCFSFLISQQLLAQWKTLGEVHLLEKNGRLLDYHWDALVVTWIATNTKEKHCTKVNRFGQREAKTMIHEQPIDVKKDISAAIKGPRNRGCRYQLAHAVIKLHLPLSNYKQAVASGFAVSNRAYIPVVPHSHGMTSLSSACYYRQFQALEPVDELKLQAVCEQVLVDSRSFSWNIAIRVDDAPNLTVGE